MNQQPFFDIFRTGKQEMEKVIAAGLSAGGDWCDLYFEYSVYNDLMLRDGEVNSGGYYEDFGVGIRVLDGERTGYAYSESTELKDMIAAAKAASAISADRVKSVTNISPDISGKEDSRRGRAAGGRVPSDRSLTCIPYPRRGTRRTTAGSFPCSKDSTLLSGARTAESSR